MSTSVAHKLQKTVRPRFHIRKGDTVRVVSGKEKGKTGQVLQIDVLKHKLFIEKINMVKRHQRPTQKQRQGGIIEKEGSLHISNVMLVCRNCGKATRIGIKVLDDGKKLRVCKKCQEVVDKV